MKLCLFLLALFVSAFAQDGELAATTSIDVLDANELDDDDMLFAAAIADDEQALEDEEIAAIAEPTQKRGVEQELSFEDELLQEDENELDLQENEDRELALSEGDSVSTVSQKRQAVVRASGAARFTTRSGRSNTTAILRLQIVRNQQSRRELNNRQRVAIRALRQTFATARSALIKQQNTARRTLLATQRNESTLLHQTQRTARERLMQQQLATLRTTPEAQRATVRTQLRLQRDALRQQHRQARESMQQLHTQQRQSLRLSLSQARENLRSQQQRDRQTLSTTQAGERATLRRTLLTQNAAVRQQIHRARDGKILQSFGFRLASMSRALRGLANITGLSQNTTQTIASINVVLARLQAAITAGNLTTFQASLHSVTAPLLIHLRRLSATRDLSGTVARGRIGVLISGSRALRGITPFRQLGGCIGTQRPSYRPTGAYTHGRIGNNNANNSTQRFTHSRPSVPSVGRSGASRQTVQRGSSTRVANTRVANNVVANNNGVNAAQAVGADGSVAPNTAASSSDTIPGWAVAVVVVASIATIALVVVAGLLVVRMPRNDA